MRDVGVFELGLALGVSGVVGGGFPEVGQTHWSGLGTVFRYRGPQTGRTKKVLNARLNLFELNEEQQTCYATSISYP